LSNVTQGSTKIEDPAFVSVWDLLDILQYCGDRGLFSRKNFPSTVLIDADLCPQQLVLLLIEELLDSLSIAGCRTAFGFLESRREVLIAVSGSLFDIDTTTDWFAGTISEQRSGHSAIMQ
jgi:THO complex subunit 1